MRKKLVDDNQPNSKVGNPMKYGRYAIGEIILVVIGILIALSINNWNEKRIAFNDEQVLLKILKNDFENRLKELEYLNEGRQNAVKACEKLMSFSDSPLKNYHTQNIDSLLAIAALTYRFNEKFSALDMLFNSGRINTLSSDSLKYLLVNWPALVEEMLEEQRLIVANYSEIVTVLDKFVSLRDVFQQTSWNNLEMPMITESKIKKNYQGLVNNRSFENLIATKRFLLNINIADTKLIIIDAKKIIKILQHEVR